MKMTYQARQKVFEFLTSCHPVLVLKVLLSLEQLEVAVLVLDVSLGFGELEVAWHNPRATQLASGQCCQGYRCSSFGLHKKNNVNVASI